MEGLPPVALADAAVAAIAWSLAAWEAFMARARPRGWEHLWRGLVALASGVYAVLMGLHYATSDPATAILLTKLEALAILVVFLSIPPLVGSLLGRPLPGWLLGLVLAPPLLTAALLPTDLLISREVEVRRFAWVDRPFLRMVETPLLWVAIGMAMLAVLASIGWLWRHRRVRPRATRHLAAGIAIWVGFLAVEESLRIFGQPIPVNLFEYGFLGFAVAVVTHDVRRHVELLHGAEQALDQLIEAASDAIAAVDAEGVVVATNGVLATTLGLAPDHRLEGYPLAEIVDERDQHVLAGLLADEPGGLAELRLVRPDSRVVPVEVAVLRGGATLLLLFRDVSARARATAQRLEHERAAALGSVSAAVDHHLRDALHRVASSVDAPDVRAVVDDMAAVVDALALFSSGDDEVGPVRLDRVVGAAAALAAEVVEPRARLVLDVSPGLWARATERGLAGALLEVLQFTAVRLEPGAPADNEVRVEGVDELDLVTIIVEHTGRPLCEDERRQLFAAFPEERDGFVLGVCRESVRRMGGRLTADRDGRRLTITLPRAPAAPSPVPR